MTTNFYPSGTGQSLGDTLATCAPLHALTWPILYVSSVTGSDSYSGLTPEKPFATWAAAVAVAHDGSMIVLQDGHTETITSAGLTLSLNGVVTVGGGSSAGKPTAKLAFAAGSNPGILISGARNQFRNVWFQSWTTTSANARLSITGANNKLQGCYVECGAHDTGAAISCSGNGLEIRGTTFISTATAIGSLPESALTITGTPTLLRLIDCVVDAGVYGWSNPYAIYDSVVTVQAEVEGLSLLRGAQASFAGATLGFINPQTTTGGAKVVF